MYGSRYQTLHWGFALSVDEQIIAFKARSSYKQYFAAKPAKMGLRFYDVRGVFKKCSKFGVFSKIIYLFMNIYFVPFKVIATRY